MPVNIRQCLTILHNKCFFMEERLKKTDNIGPNLTLFNNIVDILQYQTISDNIRRYLTLFEDIENI